MWEAVVGDRPKNAYQNGAYWSTPVGWVCAAVAREDEAAAVQLALEYVGTLQRDDFREDADHGAPWECAHPAGDHR
jgi:hypothetical protein